MSTPSADRALGLIGGAPWRATSAYLDGLNVGVEAGAGPKRCARLWLHNLDYGDLHHARMHGEWRAFARRLVSVGRSLADAGADRLMLCSNTLHGLLPRIEPQLPVPVLHIADAVASAAKAAGVHEVLLLGTRFTMEQPFYVDRLRSHGLVVQVPDAADRMRIDDILLNELAHGEVVPGSQTWLRDAVKQAPAVVLGCTELRLALAEAAVPGHRLDSLDAHVAQGVAFLLGA